MKTKIENVEEKLQNTKTLRIGSEISKLTKKTYVTNLKAYFRTR